MYRSAFLPTLLIGCCSQLVNAASSDTLYVYTSTSIENITASDACKSALASNVTCYTSLNKAVTEKTSWSSTVLTKICTAECTDSLQDYIASVDDACGSSTYNISGTVQSASRAGNELLWKQSVTCLEDDSTGAYCNTEFQDAAINGTGASEIGCSQCYLDYLYAIANSEFGRGLVSEDYFEARASSCSATGYTITATATSTSATATETANTRCNVTDTGSTVYTVKDGDSCTSISASQNVSTSLLTSINALDTNCTYLTTGQSLCLPDICNVYLVQTNDTCDSILESLVMDVALQYFLSWNNNINSVCSNLASLVGTYVCISPLGTTSIPTSFGLRPATTAVAVPTNAVTTSNTDCGYWYTIQDEDTCVDVANTYGISLDDFYFLNPQLNGTCGSLWVGNAYCVEAMGSIATYSGHSSVSRNYTTLDSTMDTTAVRTVNRTTTHFFYSWPTATTTTEPYNSTVYSAVSAYTLCSSALSYYGLTGYDDLPDEAYDNEAWMSEYQRICLVNANSALPTSGFNTSIVLETSTATASTGATATLSSATNTGTSTSPTATSLSVSPDGTCGSDTGYTCSGSQFGDCCSIYGYCDFGDCDAAATSTTTSTSAAASATSSISPDGTCGGIDGYICTGSQFGDCCSIYGYW
ncbi:hypothetical protein G7054_g5512 [Neopestalotiopsis clavispora]|nr:hypothetical protein G7054_g5512 [Neopestalotiopsis clavispora]